MRDGVPPRSSGTGAVQASAVPKPLGRWLRPELGTFLLIDELKERSRQHYISGSLFAEAYIGLGEKDEAMSWLERAYEEHDQWMVYIKTYPGWDALRSEPRFQALVRRMNFPP